MKSVFVSEYLTSGALSGSACPPSLLNEGLKMLQALTTDLLTHPELTVHTTIDQRLIQHLDSRVSTQVISSPSQEWDQFCEMARSCDLTYVIAPEIEQTLGHRVRWLEHEGLSTLMSTADAIELVSDKLKFADWLMRHDISTPPAFLLPDRPIDQIDNLEISVKHPFIIKPRYGAGSTETRKISNIEEVNTFLDEFAGSPCQPYLLQPCFAGQPVSLCVIIEPETGRRHWLPPGRQDFEAFHYLGGTIPHSCQQLQQAIAIVEIVCDELPGLQGWIGFDFLYSDPSITTEPWMLLEVNPRLTTSYLGYRQLTRQSLAFWMGNCKDRTTIKWQDQAVTFRV